MTDIPHKESSVNICSQQVSKFLDFEHRSQLSVFYSNRSQNMDNPKTILISLKPIFIVGFG